MMSHNDLEELELYSERDGLHLSDHGTAVYLTQLDAELTRVMNPRPRGCHPPSFINRLFFQKKQSKTSQDGEWSLSSISIWSRRSMLQQHPCRGLAGSGGARKSPQTKRSMSEKPWYLPHLHEQLTNGHLPPRPNLRLRLAQLEPARHRAGIKNDEYAFTDSWWQKHWFIIKHAVVSSEIGIWWRRWTFRTLFEWTPNISRIRLSHSILHHLDG